MEILSDIKVLKVDIEFIVKINSRILANVNNNLLKGYKYF